MFSRLRNALAAFLLLAAPANAAIFSSYPFILQNGTLADASQVMADFNAISNAVNASAANAPLNTNISSLSGLINGSTSVPSLAWFNFNTTGFYYDTANQCIGVSNVGTEVGCWNGSGIHLLPAQTSPLPGDAATVGYVQAIVGSQVVQGRLTLATNTPVMTSNVLAASTVYFTPYVGNAMVYSTGTTIGITTFSELSQLLSDNTLSPAAAVANKVYDMFFWYYTSTTFTGVTSNTFKQITSIGGINNGTASLVVGASVTGACIPGATTISSIDSPTQITLNNAATCNGSATFSTNQSLIKTFVISRGPAWTNNTTRGYNLTRVGGFLTNASTITNGPLALGGIYLGTIATDSGGATATWQYGAPAAGGTPGSFQVWNMYNRVDVATAVSDTAATWTYNLAVWRPAHGSTGMSVAWVAGLQEDGAYTSYQTKAANGGNGIADCGVGIDSTTVPSSLQSAAIGSASNPTASGNASLMYTPGQGVHAASALEDAETAINTTFFGGAASVLNWRYRM